MRLSVEAKVAASVAAGFVALTVGVIAQGNNGGQIVNPSGYGPTINSEVSTRSSQQGYDRSLRDFTNTEEHRHRTR